MTVKTILSRKGRGVVTIEPSAALEVAIATLAEHRIGALVVLGADGAGHWHFVRARYRAHVRGIRLGCANQKASANHDPRGRDLWRGRYGGLHHGADDRKQSPTHSGG